MGCFRRIWTSWTAAVLLATTSAAAGAQDDKTIRLGWTAWQDAELVTYLARDLLEDRLGYRVELLQADIRLQYAAVADGTVDAILMAWLPSTHASYWETYSDRLEDLGVIYGGARLGWAVPGYVPEEQLDTIADLNKPEVRRRLGGRIQGIDPSSGLMQASKRAVDEYGLSGYTLIEASGAAMEKAFESAINAGDWVVVTTWSPHWMSGLWEMRYLQDPKRVMGGTESVHAIGRSGLRAEMPDAARFLGRFSVPLADLEELMVEASSFTSSPQEAAARYIQDHPQRVARWLGAGDQ